MSDILSVCLQDILYSRKSELWKQIVRTHFLIVMGWLWMSEMFVIIGAKVLGCWEFWFLTYQVDTFRQHFIFVEWWANVHIEVFDSDEIGSKSRG